MEKSSRQKIRTVADLQRIRAAAAPRLKVEKGCRIVVGLGTCGVAAGARAVYDAMREELEKHSPPDVVLEPTGCVGICQFEPVVEVYEPGGVRTTYVYMTPEMGVRVIRQHICGGNPLAEFTIGDRRGRR